jgi:hypothetical protein
MADETNFEVGLHVATTSDDAKLADVVAELQKINTALAQQQTAQKEAGDAAKAAADKAKDAAEQHGNALNDLVGKLGLVAAAYDAIRGAWDSFKEGTQEFMLQQRALGQLSNIVKQFGQDGEEAAKQTEALARRLAAVGLNENEVIQGAQRMTFVTGDYKQALSAASLAADASVKTGNNYAETLNIIQMLMMDNKRGVLMAHRQLGIEATTCAGALAEIDARARGAAEQLKDATAAAAGFSTIIKERWKEMGGMVASVWAPLARFSADYEKKQEEATIELEWRFKRMIGSTADADAWYAEALKKWKEKFGVPLGEEFAKLGTMGDKSLTSPAALAASAAKMKEAMTKLQKDVDASVSDQEEKDKKAEEAQKQRNEHTLAEFKINEEIKSKRELWARIGKEEITAQATQGEKTLAALRMYDAKVDAIKKLAAADVKKMTTQELADHLAALKQALALDEQYAGMHLDLTKAEAQAEKQIKLDTTKVTTDMALYALQTGAQAIATAFEGNKAAAIAEATISTGVAAMHGFEMQPFWPVGLAMGALAIAKGMQQIKAIESTSIGGGGGTSGGGGSSAVYGGTSLSTPIPTIQNSSVQNQSNIRGGDTYNIHAITGSEAVASTMKLQNALRPGSRAYDRQITSRKPVSAGTVRRG